ncbi:MAG: hypothetical protein DDT34_02380 [Firmicutes bacterium]|nr:hypothetical protein [Bacillota bacterium]
MLQPIVVMRKRAARVVRRVDEHALYLSRKLSLQRFQRQQVVAEDQPVAKDIVLRHAMFGVVRLAGVFEQDARLQLGPLFLPDPGEF